MGKLMMPPKIAEREVVPERRMVFAIRLSRRGSLCRRGEEGERWTLQGRARGRWSHNASVRD